MAELGGKVAVVTGGSSGIGRAIALALGEAGAAVALVARRLPELQRAAEGISAQGGLALAISCDVADPGQIEAMRARVSAELGPCDILVNGAGVAESHKFLDHPDDIWHRALSVNLTGCYYACKAFVPDMVERRAGRILNLGSIASKVGDRYIVAYTASKHGLLGLTRALAVELAPYGITVNALCPGYVDTPMTAAGIERIAARTGRSAEQVRKVFENTNLQRRLLDPGEVIPMAMLLLGQGGSAITGQAINVDAGSVMY